MCRRCWAVAQGHRDRATWHKGAPPSLSETVVEIADDQATASRNAKRRIWRRYESAEIPPVERVHRGGSASCIIHSLAPVCPQPCLSRSGKASDRRRRGLEPLLCHSRCSSVSSEYTLWLFLCSNCNLPGCGQRHMTSLQVVERIALVEKAGRRDGAFARRECGDDAGPRQTKVASSHAAKVSMTRTGSRS